MFKRFMVLFVIVVANLIAAVLGWYFAGAAGHTEQRSDACRTFHLFAHEDIVEEQGETDGLFCGSGMVEPKANGSTPVVTSSPTITTINTVVVTDEPIKPIVTETPEPTQPIVDITPAPEKEKANCGVGNGVDGDTPGCPNGRNDGPGTGPGNPGSKGGNGNNS